MTASLISQTGAIKTSALESSESQEVPIGGA